MTKVIISDNNLVLSVNAGKSRTGKIKSADVPQRVVELNRKIEDIQISCVMDSSNLAEIVLSALEELHLSLEKLSAGRRSFADKTSS